MAFQFTPLSSRPTSFGSQRFNFQRKKPGQFGGVFGGSPIVSDPSQLTPTAVSPQPKFTTGFQSLPGGRTQILRQTTEQANRPRVPSFTPPGQRPVNEARIFQSAIKPAGFDPTASQFPFELRRGISSDASRQRAFNVGFGAGEGRTGFARRSTDTFFDPRFMFDPNFKRWQLQQQQLRRL